ncbi:hypothetical protein [Roseivirga sp.]|uniref:hypothetical protein n=1 Tax=Roseivirga sp. TaxID=1964215 RepID=UPI003B8EA4D0
MLKKLTRNIIMLFSIMAVVCLSCDQRSDEEKWMAEIRYFIMIQADDFKSYEAIDFQKIDVDFLMSNKEIQSSLVTLQDTTRTKLRFYARLENASNQLIDDLTQRAHDFSIDNVDEFQLEKAKMDKALSDHFQNLPETLSIANRKEQKALNTINKSLEAYGLSIYNINLTDGKSVFYLHSFRLKSRSHKGIFELNKETLEVSSFKEI